MTIPTPTTDLAAEEIAIGDTETWLRPDREGIFAKLRAERPLAFFKEVYPTGIDDTNAIIPLGPGFWALTRYDDVIAVSRDADNFHSAPSTNITDIPVEIAEWLGSMINMDSPKHTRMRLIVNRAFTPRRVALIEDNVRAVAQEIVAAVAPLGQCDFVSEIRGICLRFGLYLRFLCFINALYRRFLFLMISIFFLVCVCSLSLHIPAHRLFPYSEAFRFTKWVVLYRRPDLFLPSFR